MIAEALETLGDLSAVIDRKSFDPTIPLEMKITLLRGKSAVREAIQILRTGYSDIVEGE